MADGASLHRVATESAGPAGDPPPPTRLDSVRELRKTAPEAETPAVPKAATAEKAAPAPRRRLTRPLLFALLPIALVAGGYFYVTGGQVMSTDNAYVQADTVGVSTDVPGTVVAIEVHDNEPVKKGQVLYRLRQDTFQIALDG